VRLAERPSLPHQLQYAPGCMESTAFDILAELFAKDVDEGLLRRSLQKTPEERLIWLEEMQALAQEIRERQPLK
jgi:hypothetical protein